MPFRGLDICFYLFGVCAAVDIDLTDAGHGEELEGVFDERCVCEWEETLFHISSISSLPSSILLPGLEEGQTYSCSF